MGWSPWRTRWGGWLLLGLLPACGLPSDGLSDTTDGGLDAGTLEDAWYDSGSPGVDASLPDASTQDAKPSVDAPVGTDSGSTTKDASGDAPTLLETSGPCQGTSTSCGAPGQCVDCTTGSQGSSCVNGVCGCTQTNGSDCPSGNACNTGTHTCGTACSGGNDCNGGCCRNGTCSAGEGNDACGKDGKACKGCTGDKPTCSAGSCTGACGGATDGICGNSCCAGGTCAGIGPATCGASGGTCTDCTNAPAGNKCVNGACGCGANGDCGMSPQGTVCINNTACGCNVPADCPANMACDNISHKCGTGCGPTTSACNGGCCSLFQCVQGNTDGACGKGGATCANCMLSGQHCNPGGNCN